MCVSHLKPSSTKRKKKHKAAAASNAPPTGSEVRSDRREKEREGGERER